MSLAGIKYTDETLEDEEHISAFQRFRLTIIFSKQNKIQPKFGIPNWFQFLPRTYSLRGSKMTYLGQKELAYPEKTKSHLQMLLQLIYQYSRTDVK